MALYIPKKIKVGFQKRSGTVGEGLLGYVIYIDDKGKLRKETSWQGWRDKEIEPVEYDNAPTSGFIINEAIQRGGGWDWYSDTVTKVRIYDSRGFEFEITAQNLISVLMHTDCLKRGLDGELVYAWAGKDLVLLPTNSQEYKDAVQFTELQRQKISSKDLKPGYAYLDKKQETCIYLGYFDWYHNSLQPGKRHIFGYEADWYDRNDGYKKKRKWEIGYKTPSDIKEQVSTHEVSEYGMLLDNFNKSDNNQTVVSYTLVPTELDCWGGSVYIKGKTRLWRVELSRLSSYYKTHYLNKVHTVQMDKTVTASKAELKDFLEDLDIPLSANLNRHASDEHYLKYYPEEAARFEMQQIELKKLNPKKLVAISDKNKQLQIKQ